MPVPVRCHGCEALEEARQSIPQGANGYGVKVSLVPFEAYAEHEEAREQEAAARRRRKS